MNNMFQLDNWSNFTPEQKRKVDRVVARYVLDWTFSEHPDAQPESLIPRERKHEYAQKSDLPMFTTNDYAAMYGLNYLIEKDKGLRYSIKAGYVDTINSMYYSIVLKEVVNGKLLLYNGNGRTLADATLEAMLKYKSLYDWAQMMDKA